MNNITILRGGAIGDFVLTLPAINAVRKAFPTHDLRLIGHPATLALGGVKTLLDHDDSRLIPLHREGPIPVETRDLFATTERVLAYAVDPEQCLARQLRQIVAGPVLLWDPRPPADSGDHLVDHLLHPLREWNIPVCDRTPHIELAPDHNPSAAAPQIIIHPGSGAPVKCWPEAQFRALADALQTRDWEVAFLCGPVEIARGLATDCAIVQPPDLPTLASLLARAKLFIGNDSGPGHIAAAVGTPTLSLFGPTDPRVWAPRNPAGQVLQAPTENIAEIFLATVVDTALQMLENGANG